MVLLSGASASPPQHNWGQEKILEVYVVFILLPSNLSHSSISHIFRMEFFFSSLSQNEGSADLLRPIKHLAMKWVKAIFFLSSLNNKCILF